MQQDRVQSVNCSVCKVCVYVVHILLKCLHCALCKYVLCIMQCVSVCSVHWQGLHLPVLCPSNGSWVRPIRR